MPKQNVKLKTTFAYAVGAMEEVKQGEVSRVPFNQEFNAFPQLLPENQGLILTPGLIGVYQIREHIDVPEAERGLARESERMTEESVDRVLQEIYRIKDQTHRDLIHLIYDPSQWVDTSLVRTSLADPLDRIRISPVTSVPNFYEKDPHALYRLTQKMEDKIGGRDVVELDSDELQEIFDSLAPEAETLQEQFAPFGLTREEVVTLKNFLGH